MNIKVKKIEEIEVTTLKVSAGVRYWEDAEINGEPDIDAKIPFRTGDYWEPVIELNTGKIKNWPPGISADVHYKVCDDGRYSLLDNFGNTIVCRNGYVPKIMCPGGQGYGDYIIMKVDESGIIENWEPNLEGFGYEEED